MNLLWDEWLQMLNNFIKLNNKLSVGDEFETKHYYIELMMKINTK